MPNPHVSDSVHWDAAMEHYHWDRLEAAYGEIQEWGIGEAGSYLPWFRVIEAELLTRRRAEQIQITNWLKFEYVPDEVLDLRDGLARRIADACESVADHFGWTHCEETLISILAEETDAPWATHPYGYCAHKEPYEKICLPNYLVDDPDEFSQAVAHEYAHVVSESLGDGNTPRWLEEAISVFIEMRFDEETRRKFQDGAVPWYSAPELEVALVGRIEPEDDAEDPEQVNEDDIWIAYQQAGWVGRYLDSLGGGRKVASLLRKVADEAPAWNLKRTLRGHDRVEAALRDIYGLSTEQLFAQAMEYLMSPRELVD